ncbi:uncharacterized protein A4U43_C07F33960 [Asparagus officinalis]|uniref:Uncharacterized protein n=1 Tax=Asparagus officinalis TaxID=4686 RepID=A0A5P1EGU4_ASPOF|nr:uncharacterized protein A4U43_C07F33960 [Asparagus officinalis]
MWSVEAWVVLSSGSLSDEKLQLPNVSKGLAGAHQEVLRNKPETADLYAALDLKPPPLVLNDSGRSHCQHSEHEPNDDALEAGHALNVWKCNVAAQELDSRPAKCHKEAGS